MSEEVDSHNSDSDEKTDEETGTDEGSASSDSTLPEYDDEPILKYKRFAKDTIYSIHKDTKNVISCIAVHEKFIAVGTFAGIIYMLDHTGASLSGREYALHAAQVNQISIDQEGEIFASCSDDSKVCVVGLFNNKYNQAFSLDRAVKSVAVNPHFSKGANQVVTGTDNKLSLMDLRRWLLGNIKFTTSELHGGYGTVSNIRWKDSLIAWANDTMVCVYDTTLKEMISTVLFEEESLQIHIPPTSLCWLRSDTLLVGRGHLVKIAKIETEKPMDDLSDSATLQRRKKFMTIAAQNSFSNFLVCGVVAITSDENMDLVVLGYDSRIDMKAAVSSGAVPPPQLFIVPPGIYDQEKKCYNEPEEKSQDKLLPKGYKYFHCWEYHLECVEKEDRFYIVTPTDIILAEKRNSNDHVDWLMEHKDFEGALKYAQNPRFERDISSEKTHDIGVKYLYHLIKSNKFDEAAPKCPQFLGPKDKSVWEDIVYHFIKKDQLKALHPFIPIKDPVLSPAMYELILHNFLKKADSEAKEGKFQSDEGQILIKLIRVWPSDLYKAKAIINAVKACESYPCNPHLLNVLALLYSNEGMIEEALKIHLQQKDPHVFDLIQEKKLYNALLDNLVPLMELNAGSAVRLLIEWHDEKIPVSKVVQQMDLSHANQEFLHKYLDSLYEKDSKAGIEYHERQVELYAKYDKGKLLRFLRTGTAVPLEKALHICEHYKCYEEMVHILREMGNPTGGLQLIIRTLGDVEKAIQFVTELQDEELWDLLINESVKHPEKKSEFITGLLKNVGTHIDPTVLIQKIPNGTVIPELGSCLVKLLQDFSVQVNLTEGCKKILVKDSQSLMSKLHKMQARAICVEADTVCKGCGDKVMENEELTDYFVFFCGHIYHNRCASTAKVAATVKDAEVMKDVFACRYCFAGIRSKKADTLIHKAL